LRRNPWEVRDALDFIGSSGGRLVTVSPEQISFLRHVLLKVEDADTALWLLRWLKNEKHCEPAVYHEVTRTVSMRRRLEALNAGVRYLSPSQKRARANGRRGRTAERKGSVTPERGGVDR